VYRGNVAELEAKINKQEDLNHVNSFSGFKKFAALTERDTVETHVNPLKRSNLYHTDY
jgi:hypothetical protein